MMKEIMRSAERGERDGAQLQGPGRWPESVKCYFFGVTDGQYVHKWGTLRKHTGAQYTRPRTKFKGGFL